jgi:Family of unknown function (DUF6494)
VDEERFNISVRKFLKEVGVTSQREIEKAVREALADGKLDEHATLDAEMTLTIGRLNLKHVVDGRIELG